MKKARIILSVVVFAFAMVANIQYALDGYGVNKISLSNNVLAQSTSTRTTTTTSGSTSGSGDGSSTSNLKGPTDEIRIHCTGSTTQTITVYANGQTSNGWGVTGNATVGWKFAGSASLQGKYDASSGTSSGGVTAIVTVSNWDFWADKINCKRQKGICTSYSPC